MTGYRIFRNRYQTLHEYALNMAARRNRPFCVLYCLTKW